MCVWVCVCVGVCARACTRAHQFSRVQNGVIGVLNLGSMFISTFKVVLTTIEQVLGKYEWFLRVLPTGIHSEENTSLRSNSGMANQILSSK